MQNDELPNSPVDKIKKKQGLASLSPERRREIASMGGRAAHAAGVAHRYTTAEAIAAGIKRQSKHNDASKP